MIRIKAIYRKNLKMSESKVASQVAHSVRMLKVYDENCVVVVLGVSDKKFDELVAENNCYVQRDMGITEVPAGTATAAAWLELKKPT